MDVIIVGGGHAGVEALYATSRLGLKALLITVDLDKISVMSCNPAIGGLAKGHMVKEMDVLGAAMPFVTDESCIQFKRLNQKKGPAVRGSRAQCDKKIYSKNMIKFLKKLPNARFLEAEVKSLIVEKTKVCGVVLADGTKIRSKTTIITTGTFMNALMYVGENQTSGGRIGESATSGISDQLSKFGFSVRRLKTGTPARLAKESIDFSNLKVELGDKTFIPFSYRSKKQPLLPQIKCHLTYTNLNTKKIIEKNLKKSPIYSGIISSTGPRYCPSIEDKIYKFPDKETHQAFLEPEGLDTNSIYLQGVSTSLPAKIQLEFLRTMKGLQNVKVLKYGYAVEYDFIEPFSIKHTLETKILENLFLAGQINGTSGYEEAAAQGLVAGINACRKILNQSEFVLARDEAYIGVLIDDLVIKGTKEPYRMFTSRAEYRLTLREDNTIERLLAKSKKHNLIDECYYKKLATIKEKRISLKKKIKTFKSNNVELSKLILNKNFDPVKFKEFEFPNDFQISEPVINDIRYEGYIKRERELIEKSKKLDSLSIKHFAFSEIKGLSNEEVEKLERIKPPTLGAASRISGVNPSAIQAIMFYNRKLKELG